MNILIKYFLIIILFLGFLDVSKCQVERTYYLNGNKKSEGNFFIVRYKSKITGDIIKIKESSSQLKSIRETIGLQIKKLEVPGWILLEPKKPELKILQEPSPEDLPQNISTKLIIEHYSR